MLKSGALTRFGTRALTSGFSGRWGNLAWLVGLGWCCRRCREDWPSWERPWTLAWLVHLVASCLLEYLRLRNEISLQWRTILSSVLSVFCVPCWLSCLLVFLSGYWSSAATSAVVRPSPSDSLYEYPKRQNWPFPSTLSYSLASWLSPPLAAPASLPIFQAASALLCLHSAASEFHQSSCPFVFQSHPCSLNRSLGLERRSFSSGAAWEQVLRRFSVWSSGHLEPSASKMGPGHRTHWKHTEAMSVSWPKPTALVCHRSCPSLTMVSKQCSWCYYYDQPIHLGSTSLAYLPPSSCFHHSFLFCW